MANMILREMGSAEFRRLTSTFDKVSYLCELNFSVRKIAAALGIPKSTVQRWKDAQVKPRGLGRPNYLDEDDESKLISLIKSRAEQHNPMTEKDIRHEAHRLAQLKTDHPITSPSSTWVSSWIRNQEEVKKVVPRMIEPERDEACGREEIERWFNDITNQIDPSSYKTEFVFNMDESMLNISSHNKLKVIIPKDMKKGVKKSTEFNDKHITLIFCICADGNALKPTAILPVKHFPDYLTGMEDSFAWSGSESGWITESIYINWVKNVFVEYVNKKRKDLKMEGEKALLFVDGHATRNSIIALQILMDNNIQLVTIPAHSSHVLQPLDRGVNGVFKQNVRQFCYLEKKPGESTEEKRKFLMTAAEKGAYYAFFHRTIQNSFLVAGIFPWNKEKILENPCLIKKEPEYKIKNEERGPKKRKFSISGIVVTSEKSIGQLVESAQKKIENK